MRIRTLFLRLFIVAISLFDLALGIFALWRIPPRLVAIYGNPYTAYIAGVGMYLCFICILAAGWFAWILLNTIDRGQAFTSKALDQLHDVTLSIYGIAIGFFIMLPQIYVTAQVEDAPGMIVAVFFAGMLPLTVAVTLDIVHHLWTKALTKINAIK